MKNYSVKELQEIEEKILYYKEILSKSVTWAEANLKYEEKHKVILNTKNRINILSKMYQNIASKPVIAVFGGSQVGKSYLIKNLLSEKGQPFVIKNKEKEYDFLKDINPPGVGAESTGVVTRFTIKNEVKFEDFPIKIKLLSPKDALIIILDSFFLDIKKISRFLNNKELDAHLKKIEKKYEGPKQQVLAEYDILEIKEYFENHLSKHTILFEGLNESRFFERIASIISGFSYDQWESIFGVLWNKNSHLSSLFNILVKSLKTVDFENVGYISFKEVLRGHGEILDVQRLKELNSENKEITLKKNNGEESQINLAHITAIIAELIFSIPKELVSNKEFLENSDLLDFPGARSRLAIEIADIDQEVLPDMLLRGKVSYLFNKYSDDFNINNLLFCANDKQLDVNEIPGLLFNWIAKNIGENSLDRTKALQNTVVPPLFVIFTFFNNQLKFDTTNDFDFLEDPTKLDYKWDTRFNRFFQNEIVTLTKDWHKDWTKDQPNFKNFHLLRDFKYSTDTFNNFEIGGIETGINEERKHYLNHLQKSFLNFPFVKDHFVDPEYSWSIASKENCDGSEGIIKNLNKVSNNISKTDHYLNKLNNLLIEQKKELEVHLHTDDLALLRSRAMKNVNTLQFALNSALTKDIRIFDTLISLFALDPVEVYNLLNENIVLGNDNNGGKVLDENNVLLSQFPELSSVKSFSEAVEILKQRLWLSNSQEVEDFLIENNIKKEDLFIQRRPKTKAQTLVFEVLNYWKNKISKPENFKGMEDLGVCANSLEFLSLHFVNVIETRGLKNKLELILSDIVSETTINRGVEEFLAETFCLLINEFVNNFDLNYLTDEEKKELANFKAVKVNELRVEVQGLEGLFEDDYHILISSLFN